MVVSGFPLENNGAASVIAIGGDPQVNTVCEDLPLRFPELYGGTGGYFPGVPLQSLNEVMVCGGYNKYGKHLKNCTVLVQDHTSYNISLINERNYPSSIMVFKDKVSDLIQN